MLTFYIKLFLKCISISLHTFLFIKTTKLNIFKLSFVYFCSDENVATLVLPQVDPQAQLAVAYSYYFYNYSNILEYTRSFETIFLKDV